MYENKLAFNKLDRLVAIGKVKKYIDIYKDKKEDQVKKIILYLEPELRLILPGVSSKFYKKTKEKLDTIIKKCNDGQA